MHLDNRHPLDAKKNISFFIDRLVYQHDVAAYEALVAAVENGGTICNSVYRADVVLVDATTVDLTSLSGIPGAIVSYKYIEHCLSIGKRASVQPFIVESPALINRQRLPELPLWRQEATQQQVFSNAAKQAHNNIQAKERSKFQPITQTEDVKLPKLEASIVAEFGDDPPMPTFQTRPGEETDFSNGPAFEWCLAFVRWVAVVQPNMQPGNISKAVARMIPGVAHAETFFRMYCDTTHPQLRGFELQLVMRTTSKIAREQNLIPWEAEDVQDAITRVADRSNPARSSLRGAKVHHGADDNAKISRPPQRKQESKEPRAPAPSYLRHLPRTTEAKKWMEDWYRWRIIGLNGRPRPSREALSEEIAKKTNGALKRSSFRNYWQHHKEVFERIDAEVKSARRRRQKEDTRLDELANSDYGRHAFLLALSPEL